MSASLEDVLRNVAARGDFSHLSLSATSDGKRFQASFRSTVSKGYNVEIDKDPVVAVQRAIAREVPKRQRETPPKKKADNWQDLI